MSRHTLSEPEEKVVNLKDVNGVHALIKVYDLITNKFSFTLEVDGETRTLTRDALAAYVRHPSAAGPGGRVPRAVPGVRRRDGRARADLRQPRARLGRRESLPALVPARRSTCATWPTTSRGRSSPTLLGVCEEEAPVFQRYFGRKAGWLGMDRLRRFDLYAPVSGKSERRIPLDEAVEHGRWRGSRGFRARRRPWPGASSSRGTSTAGSGPASGAGRSATASPRSATPGC